MDDNSKLPEGFSYDELAKAFLERLKPFLQEIIRDELAIINKDISIDKPKTKFSISATEPEVVDTARYSLSETCKILNVSTKTVLRYTENGTIRCGIRKANGRKFYTGADIKKFWKAQY